ncbi:hypothetical protein [Streptomyces sp. JW3]|uniref:hypothetical protein n=1 Tax=Streptomyces sp. JW3 TaxID=3456955 RepID=UPI003FA4D01B
MSATLDGEAVMPIEVADLLLTGRGGRTPRGPEPTSDEITWLRRLADGWTVSRLASVSGYSERAMYRLLRAFYQKMGVSTRLEAVMLAYDMGWFED